MRPTVEEPLKRKEYEKELRELQVELCALQEWVKEHGERVIVVFEGRDAAGKGGVIKAITDRVSHRVFREIALPPPSDREKTQHERFLKVCPEYERYIVDDGIKLIKYWLEVSEPEQKRRFEARITDPLRQWKLSPTDLCSRSRWFDYSRARDMMLEATDTEFAPWYIVPSDDKRRARLNCISHLLSLIPYKKVSREKVKLPERSKQGAYDDEATLKTRRFVPAKY